MKKRFSAAGLAIMLAIPFVGGAAQTLTDSKHDFTSSTGQTIYTTAAGQCVTCHTPHTSSELGAVGPLWGHDTTAVAAASWNMYSSATLDATSPGRPAGVSLACLSCHDGTVALDAYGGGGTPTLVIPTTSTAYIGNDLTNDHPISIQFDAGGAEFNTAVGGMVGVAGDSVPLYGASLDQVECGSCHNPHDASTVGKFLRYSEAAICTLCHNKG